jgi:hypothetical protein
MLDHNGIVVTDLKSARRFYDAIAGALAWGRPTTGRTPSVR